MNISRLAGLFAVPAALSLAACGGGSAGVVNNAVGTGGQQAFVRFVNGEQSLGNVDIYFQSTGTAQPSTPLLTENYATASDFIGLAPTAGSVIVRTAGASSSSAAITSCPIPQLSANGKYSIVLVRAAGAGIDCAMFQDFDYTSSPQYRFHDAAAVLGSSSSVGFGVIPTPNAAPGTAFTVQGDAQLGNLAVTGTGAGTNQFVQAQPQQIGTPGTGTTTVTFAAGNNVPSGTTEPSFATLSSQFLFAPNGTSQPNTSGSLNASGSVGTSIFAIDCTRGAVQPNGVTCGANGVALIGQIDTR